MEVLLTTMTFSNIIDSICGVGTNDTCSDCLMLKLDEDFSDGSKLSRIISWFIKRGG